MRALLETRWLRTLLPVVVAALSGVVAATPAAAAPDPPTAPQVSTQRPVMSPAEPRIYNTHSDRCIGIANVLAAIYTCTKNADQRWHVGACHQYFPDFCTIVNQRGECLAVDGGRIETGRRIWGFPCSYSPDQYWTVPVLNGTALRNLSPLAGFEWNNGNPWILAVHSIRTDNGAPVLLWRWNSSADQWWDINYTY
ncbi:hypothetical protein AB0J72_45985 [Dactylosporangium sp. NPDC049742]|uniref:RICIN domain-containing protein n=1 Tax=Dactylosporangium sp. NPDC049742 TaxID=3154737 RepID=UPI0034279CF5